MNRAERRRQKREHSIEFGSGDRPKRNQMDGKNLFSSIHELKKHLDSTETLYEVLPPGDFSKVIAIECANFLQNNYRRGDVDEESIDTMLSLLKYDLMEKLGMDITDQYLIDIRSVVDKSIEDKVFPSFISEEGEL